MTTQDTGLVGECARAVEPAAFAMDRLLVAQMLQAQAYEKARAVLTAILPHLSPESQEKIREELK